MKKYLRLIKRELSFILIKDYRRGMLLIFAAVAYLALFGLLYFQGVANKVPLLVVDESNTVQSKQLVKYFKDADAFSLSGYGLTHEDAQAFLKDTNGPEPHKGVLMIPHDFADNIGKGRSSNILLMIEGSNIVVTSNSAIGGLQALHEYNRWQSSKLLERDRNQLAWQAPKRVEPVRFNYRVLNNPNIDYMFFFIIGLGLIALQNGVLLSVAAGLIYPLQPLTDEERNMPVSSYWLVKSSVYMACGFVAFLLYFLVGTRLFHLPCRASFTQLSLLVFGFIFCMTNIAGVVAPLVGDELKFNRIALFYTVPAFMLSGYTWPLAGMPEWVQILAYSSPFTYLASTSRELMLAGYSPHYMRDLAVLYGSGAICLFLGILVQKITREKEKYESC